MHAQGPVHRVAAPYTTASASVPGRARLLDADWADCPDEQLGSSPTTTETQHVDKGHLERCTHGDQCIDPRPDVPRPTLKMPHSASMMRTTQVDSSQVRPSQDTSTLELSCRNSHRHGYRWGSNSGRATEQDKEGTRSTSRGDVATRPTVRPAVEKNPPHLDLTMTH